jgi:hypothetical protein
MNIRAASLVFAFAFAALPAHAQRPDDGDQDQDRRAHAQRHDGDGDDDGHGGLVSRVAALTARVSALETQQAETSALAARVAKLEGQITAADLVGTYTGTSFLSKLSNNLIGSIGPFFGLPGAQITMGVQVGTATLAADGTVSINLTNTHNTLGYDGITVTLGGPVPAWGLVPETTNGGANTTWTYANGSVTLATGPSLSVAAGGRLLIFASSSNPNARQGDSQLVILTRLQ